LESKKNSIFAFAFVAGLVLWEKGEKKSLRFDNIPYCGRSGGKSSFPFTF